MLVILYVLNLEPQKSLHTHGSENLPSFQMNLPPVRLFIHTDVSRHHSLSIGLVVSVSRLVSHPGVFVCIFRFRLFPLKCSPASSPKFLCFLSGALYVKPSQKFNCAKTNMAES